MACADWGELLAGDYQYLNNVWNKGTSADYEQCVMRRVVDGEDQYGWRWRWPNGGGEVKALPQVLFGQSPWRNSSTTASLPRQISALETLRVDYELYIAAEGDFSLAFILWLTNADPPTPETVSHNVKIQVYRSGSAPAPGSEQVSIDGIRFNVTRGGSATPGGRTDVVFESLTDEINTQLDLLEFLDHLIGTGHLSPDHYVAVVEMGTEVMGGSGEVWIGDYAIQAESSVSPSGRLVIPRPDPTLPPADPLGIAPVEEACGDWDEFRLRTRIYMNNVWNKGNVTGYENCIMRRVVDGADQYGWRWSWPPSIDDVRAYPKIVYGRTPWESRSTTPQLPKRISSLAHLEVDYEAYMTAEGAFNLAFSMWVASDNPPSPQDELHEIMVWVDWQGFYPSGEQDHVADGEIDGSGFSLYVRQHENAPAVHPSLIGQKYLGFALHTDRFSGLLDLGAFLDYLVENGHVPDDHYLTHVELGNEVMNGTGELWLESFRVTVR